MLKNSTTTPDEGASAEITYRIRMARRLFRKAVLFLSFVKRRSSLVVGSVEARSRDTLHEERFTDDGNAAGGLCQQPARERSGVTEMEEWG